MASAATPDEVNVTLSLKSIRWLLAAKKETQSRNFDLLQEQVKFIKRVITSQQRPATHKVVTYLQDHFKKVQQRFEKTPGIREDDWTRYHSDYNIIKNSDAYRLKQARHVCMVKAVYGKDIAAIVVNLPTTAFRTPYGDHVCKCLFDYVSDLESHVAVLQSPPDHIVEEAETPRPEDAHTQKQRRPGNDSERLTNGPQSDGESEQIGGNSASETTSSQNNSIATIQQDQRTVELGAGNIQDVRHGSYPLVNTADAETDQINSFNFLAHRGSTARTLDDGQYGGRLYTATQQAPLDIQQPAKRHRDNDKVDAGRAVDQTKRRLVQPKSTAVANMYPTGCSSPPGVIPAKTLLTMLLPDRTSLVEIHFWDALNAIKFMVEAFGNRMPNANDGIYYYFHVALSTIEHFLAFKAEMPPTIGRWFIDTQQEGDQAKDKYFVVGLPFDLESNDAFIFVRTPYYHDSWYSHVALQ
jgi:hypothetical protein